MLLKNGADLNIVNMRGWVPLNLADHNEKFFKDLKLSMKEEELQTALTKDSIQDLLCSGEKLTMFDTSYHYVIISIADSLDPKETTIYRQLKNIKDEWSSRGMLTIKIYDGYSNNIENLSQVGLQAEDAKAE